MGGGVGNVKIWTDKIQHKIIEIDPNFISRHIKKKILPAMWFYKDIPNVRTNFESKIIMEKYAHTNQRIAMVISDQKAARVARKTELHII